MFNFIAGHYVYVEASTPNSKGDKFRLQSQNFAPQGPACLRIWYHMFGAHIGTLNVFEVQNQNSEVWIWTGGGRNVSNFNTCLKY